MVHKLMYGAEKVDREKFSSLSNKRTLGHPANQFSDRFKTDKRKDYFTQ